MHHVSVLKQRCLQFNMYRQCALALLALYVGLAHAFVWEIVMVRGNKLHFYNNGRLTHTEQIVTDDYKIKRIAYDPVRNNVFFAYEDVISSFDIITKKIEVVYRGETSIVDLTFDPLTETIFWVDCYYGYIYSISSFSIKTRKHGYNFHHTLSDMINYIAVDGCESSIYWRTKKGMRKAPFGNYYSNKINVFEFDYLFDFTIDPITKKMYWMEGVEHYQSYNISVKSADLNGQNRKTLYMNIYDGVKGLQVSNDFIYWRESKNGIIWQIPKSTPQDGIVKPKKTFTSCSGCDFAVNYKIQAKEIICGAIESLPLTLPDDSHICHNYCLQGDCSVSAKGQPKCRCNAGYSGERCKVNACHEYCMNNGVCSLNEKSEPVCQCTGDYEGRRCNVPVSLVKCFQTFSMFRNILETDVTPGTLGIEVNSTCAPTVA